MFAEQYMFESRFGKEEKMKRRFFSLGFLGLLMLPFWVLAQSNFSVEAYRQFLTDNQNLSADALLTRYAPPHPYYTETAADTVLDGFAYMDTVRLLYGLTDDEVDLLQKHHFMVTERLSFYSFGEAFHNVYAKDLPVFITTDAILQALHASYDKILMGMEIYDLKPKLGELLDALYDAFPQLLSTYQNNPAMHPALADVDLYITIARSLLAEALSQPRFVDADVLNTMWSAIQEEAYAEMPLFSERNRRLDFSQFTVRGHYTHRYWDGEKTTTLGSYFKTMMWLGRMDFLLTPPPENPWEPPWTREEIRRMNLGAVLLNELLGLAGARNLLDEIDETIRFFVGESDNLTPTQLAEIVASFGFQRTDELLADSTYDVFQDRLIGSPESGQKILSSIFLMDPFSTEPGTLPVSFRLMGQRFVVDSYIFSNVVFDRIVYNGQKVWRPMPDPLDAMFVLGNDDAAQLLKSELDRYHYSSQLATLRYLVDAYDGEFWNLSLYNVWLQSIRLLNPPEDRAGFPFFMKTVAWQQEKLNTQLASWAQLRHDNLLYAKQSYTGGTACSFPHSFVEPYPAFYRQIGHFAEKAYTRFSDPYFQRLGSVMDTLATLAQKELDRESFSQEETKFLQRMLFVEGGSGEPPFSGWYADLFYDTWDAAMSDYLVADVHTQPTDEFGGVVGRVLHVGVGKVNLGVFLADAPAGGFQPTAFVGPVMSYYEKITEDFDRLTDERWEDFVVGGNLPDRPDWTRVYLADRAGRVLEGGRELQGQVYTHADPSSGDLPSNFALSQNYPNPFNPVTTIRYVLPKPGFVSLRVYDLLGREVAVLVNAHRPAGAHTITWHAQGLSSGVYLYRLEAGDFVETRKLILQR